MNSLSVAIVRDTAVQSGFLTDKQGAVRPAKTDQPEIEAIVGRIRAKDYRLRTLIHEIVQSTVFQSK